MTAPTEPNALAACPCCEMQGRYCIESTGGCGGTGFIPAGARAIYDTEAFAKELSNPATRLYLALAAWNTRSATPDAIEDPQPEIVGSPLAKIISYNQAHETAVEMCYPSLTEALEHLDELRNPTPDAGLAGELATLASEFGRWLEKGPNGQPHYPGGVRPFSTGDLKHFTAVLTKASTALSRPTAEQGAVEALREIARQKLPGEPGGEEEEQGDWLSGYEGCVNRARAALAATPTTASSASSPQHGGEVR